MPLQAPAHEAAAARSAGPRMSTDVSFDGLSAVSFALVAGAVQVRR